MALFKPRALIPNTLDPALKGLDWACMANMFAGCLASTIACVPRPAAHYSTTEVREMARELLSDEAAGEDVALKNLEGNGARELAERWADSGKFRRKFEVMRQYLKGTDRAIVERIMAGAMVDDAPSSDLPASDALQAEPSVPANVSTVSKPRSIVGRATAEETKQAMANIIRKKPKYAESGSGDETEGDDDDARGRFAHMLFAPLAGIHEDPYGASIRSSSPVASSPPSTPRKQADQQLKIASGSIFATSSSKGGPQGGSPRTPTRRKPMDTPPHRLPGPTIPNSSPGVPLPDKSDSQGTMAQVVSERGEPSGPTTRTYPRTPTGSQNQATRLMALATPASRSRPDKSPQAGCSSPLEDLQNVSARSRPSSPSPAPKRRKINKPDILPGMSSRTLPVLKPIEGASALPEITRGALPAVFPTTAQSKPASASASGLHQQQTLSAKSTLLLDTTRQTSTREDPDKARRRALKLEREITEEKLFRARPDLASKAYIAKRERKLSRLQREQDRNQQRTPGLLQAELTARSEQDLNDSQPASGLLTSASRVLQRLPSRDQEDESSVRINRERSRLLAEQFKQEIAQGRRPGLVIPRMQCLESQEA